MSIRVDAVVQREAPESTGCMGRPCGYLIQHKATSTMSNTFFVTSKPMMYIDDASKIMSTATYEQCGTLLQIGKNNMSYGTVYAFDTHANFDAKHAAEYLGMRVVPHGPSVMMWMDSVRDWQGDNPGAIVGCKSY